MLIMPVANGLLPHPQGGRITGAFFMEHAGKMLKELSRGQDILLCPASKTAPSQLYPVGVAARVFDMWQEKAVALDGSEKMLLMATFEGRSHAKWDSLRETGGFLLSDRVEYVNLKKISLKYPLISGAGWLASGGYTEIRDRGNIKVTIYGNALDNGKKVSVTANLGDLVAPEQAHTIEHSIIRALNTYCLCSIKTLVEAMRRETDELKKSVEISLKYTLPEAIGVTQSGFCGNPMSNLAQFYLAKEFVGGLKIGKSLEESLTRARRVTMSQLTNDVGITNTPVLRALQGLKRGMAHDDTLLKMETYKKIIARFAFDPWEA